MRMRQCERDASIGKLALERLAMTVVAPRILFGLRGVGVYALQQIVPQRSLAWLSHGDGVQSHRCRAVYPSRHDVDDDRKHAPMLNDCQRRGTCRQTCPQRGRDVEALNAASKALASWRSAVSKPSVNQP